MMVFFVLSTQNIFACGWFYTVNVHGKHIEKGENGELRFIRVFSEQETLDELKKIEKSLFTTYNYKEHSDYALLLSRIGKIKESLDILIKLNEQHPNQYILIANLGTLYELNGKNEEALHWIQKAMKKNPDSHYGSEWVHVKILEAKLNIQKNPSWLKNNRILGIDFSKYEVVPLLSKVENEISTIGGAIAYQLHERIPYTPAPDPIVFQLLIDFAHLEIYNDLHSSHLAYHFALVFTNNQEEKTMVETKIKEIEALLIKFGKTPRHKTYYPTYGAILHISDYKVIDFFPKIKNQESKTPKNKLDSNAWILVVGILVVMLLFFVVLYFKRVGKSS
jgi:tetratricopeptide (TPR) repeat protein